MDTLICPWNTFDIYSFNRFIFICHLSFMLFSQTCLSFCVFTIYIVYGIYPFLFYRWWFSFKHLIKGRFCYFYIIMYDNVELIKMLCNLCCTWQVIRKSILCNIKIVIYFVWCVFLLRGSTAVKHRPLHGCRATEEASLSPLSQF